MKKVIFGIFAHPDDEAFGPCGTLLQETRNGSELHLITLTSGQAGMNPDNTPHLGEVRLKEWREAGRLLGATSMHHLGYEDGTLNNLRMIEISERLVELITPLASAADEVEFMIFDLNGFTGHIDHIVASRAACHAFFTLKKTLPQLTKIRLYTLPQEQQPDDNIDWIYMEKGRSESEIAEVVDARMLRDDIIAVMRKHHTQRSDCDAAIKSRGADLGLDHFLVKT